MARNTVRSVPLRKIKSSPKGVLPKFLHNRDTRGVLDDLLPARGSGRARLRCVQLGGQLGEGGLLARGQRVGVGDDDVNAGEVAAGDGGGAAAERDDEGAGVLQGAQVI